LTKSDEIYLKCYFELSIHQRILKKMYGFAQKYLAALAANQHIRMISKGSCDTED